MLKLKSKLLVMSIIMITAFLLNAIFRPVPAVAVGRWASGVDDLCYLDVTKSTITMVSPLATLVYNVTDVSSFESEGRTVITIIPDNNDELTGGFYSLIYPGEYFPFVFQLIVDKDGSRSAEVMDLSHYIISRMWFKNDEPLKEIVHSTKTNA